MVAYDGYRDPKRFTLNPKSFTLDPEPFTLNAEPLENPEP